MKAIILDGFHAGTCIEHDGNPVLFMVRLPTITLCACNADEVSMEENEKSAERIEYRLAARGEDCLLYSLKGDLFDPITKGRDWTIDKDETPFRKRKPIFFDCHDRHAWD